ncbi:MAG: hypothetical protein ACREMS_02275 [Gemmatimonadaceae bacterium]
MNAFGFQLTAGQATVITTVLCSAVLVGLAHWLIVARVSRTRNGSGLADRLLPFGFGSWHIGVLRRSWYPDDALPLRRWVLITYWFSLGGVLLVAALLMIWVVF